MSQATTRYSERPSVAIIDEADSLSVAIVDFVGQRISARTFPLPTCEHTTLAAATSAIRAGEIAVLAEIGEFLDRELGGLATPRFLLQMPSDFRLPVDGSRCLLALHLAHGGYVEIPVVAPRLHADHLQVCTLPHGMCPAEPPNSALYLQAGVATAYAELLLGSCEFTEVAAIVAALIAEHEALYHYFIATGLPPSGPDIVGMLESQLKYRELSAQLAEQGIAVTIGDGSQVIAPDDVFGYGVTLDTRFDRLHEIVGTYQQHTEKYLYLGENQAYKMALLEVCRQWRVSLDCHSIRYSFRLERAVYRPEHAMPEWVAEFLDV